MYNNDLVNELGTNFIEYAVAVNTDRAIPDARDGLKPVAKRILWSTFEEGRTSNKPHVKAARIVGDVMGRYHPHGDSSIYGAMVRLSQPWIMRYPLVDWHGNNGNIAGDGPAAARYTEARLTKITEEGLLSHIKENNVDFIPNYDESLEEPVCLPSSFPNLLCNPNSGIGVAMACNWAPHNLRDVASAIYSYMDGDIPTIPAPDFPTGGLIINGDECADIISKGRGSIKIRARYKVEDNKIIFYEVPYGETIEGLLAQLGEVCNKNEIEGITDAHDESNKKGIRIVIEVGKSINPDTVAEKIYRKTNFQTTFAYNQVALVDKTPTELGLRDCCRLYLKHNRDCLVKETDFNLTKATERLEIVNGLLKALEDIDNIISLIKKSDNSTKAKEALIEKYSFTEKQAKAILAMRLSSLTKLDAIELNKEAEDLKKKIYDLSYLLQSKQAQINEIRRRLEELVKKYGDDRRTEITNITIAPEKKEKKEIIPKDVVVVVDNAGNIKRIPKMNFKVQKKRNKGIKNLDDNILSTISTNTLDTLMVFTNIGKMYKILIDKIPEGDNGSKGVNLRTIFSFESKEKVQAVINLKDKTNAEYAVFFTKNGLIKKTDINEYKNVKRNNGTQAIKIKEDDELVNVTFLKDEEVLVITQKGMCIRFETESIRPIGRITSGRNAIKLSKGDCVIAGLPINRKDEQKFLVAGSKSGNCVRINLEEFSKQLIAGKGVKYIKLAAADIVINGIICTEEDNILIIGEKHSKAIEASEIIKTPRDSAGRAIIKDENLKHLVKL